jgi:hypothetical protein
MKFSMEGFKVETLRIYEPKDLFEYEIFEERLKRLAVAIKDSGLKQSLKKLDFISEYGLGRIIENFKFYLKEQGIDHIQVTQRVTPLMND